MIQAPPTGTNSYDPATLVVILPIHQRGNDEYRCGDMSMSSMMTALSILYTLENPLLVSSLYRFNLRALIIDNCANTLRIDQDLMSLFTEGDLCNDEFDTLGSIIDKSTVMGVQTTSSRYVVAANRITAQMQIQLMSSSASSTALSDRWRYPYFTRTVPPDNVQMALIAKILKENNWSYVGVIYTLESYGINGYRTLQDIVNTGALSCIGVAQGVSVNAPSKDLREAVKTIGETEGVGVIVLIVANPRPILDALIAEGVANRFVVIGTDAWGKSYTIIEGVADQFAGAMTISFRDAYYLPFIDHVRRITYTNRMGLPTDWFEEFYQQMHECHLTDARKPQTQYTTTCTKNLRISIDQVRKYGEQLHPIMATLALGKGLSMFASNYGCGTNTFTQCMDKVANSRDALFNMTLQQTQQMIASELDPPDNFKLELGYDDRYWNVGYTVWSVRRAGTYDKVK